MSHGGAFGLSLLLVVLLPVPMALIRVAMGAREAWFALAIAVGMWLVWWAYYGTDWLSRGGPGGTLYLLGPAALSWLVLVVPPAARAARRSRG